MSYPRSGDMILTNTDDGTVKMSGFLSYSEEQFREKFLGNWNFQKFKKFLRKFIRGQMSNGMWSKMVQ